MQKMAFVKWRGRCETLPEQEQELCHLFASSVSVCRHYLPVLTVACWLIVLASGLNEKIQVVIVVGE